MKKKESNLLQLLPSEKKVFGVLSAVETISPAEIVRRAKTSRTTVLHVLNKLQSRGLIQSVVVGKRKEWKRTSGSVLEQEISGIETFFDIPHKKGSIPGFAIISGTTELKYKYWELLKTIPKHGRFVGVQTTDSGLSCIKKLGEDEVRKMNEFISKQQFVVVAVLEEDWLSRIAKKHSKEWLLSFKNRIAATAFVPKNYFSFNAELDIFGTKAMLVNWEDESAVLIENKEVVHMLKSLFQFMHDNGRRLNHNEIAKIILEDKKK